MTDSPPLPPWVAKIGKKKEEGDIKRLFFFLMKELHLSYDDLLNMPVPAIIGLSDEMANFNKEQEKQMKKSRGKG